MGAYLDIRASLERFCVSFSHQNFATPTTSFPTSFLSVGMIVYRTDQDKLYRLESLTPQWVEIDYDYFLFDFDAHAEETNFPATDFIGIRDISMVTEDKNFIVSCAFGVSIAKDSNLQRHNKIIDKLFEKLYPNKSIPVYDISNNNGAATSNFLKVMDGSEVLPVARADARVIQFIGAFLGTGLTAK
jgi:hypothetical protein